MSPDLKLLRGDKDAPASGVDPRAQVHSSARLGHQCAVGPFAVIGPDVVLGDGCTVHPHAVITGPSVFGSGNEFHPFSCVGGAPQDLRHRGEPTRLEAGDGNVFREHVTVNRGTVHGGGVTRIGSFNLFMAYCHVAHDCIIGDRVVMANNATLAGHVTVQDHAVFGGMVAVASFLRIGESAMLAAGSMLERDVPPFAMVGGNRARLCGVNRVGLRRRGFGPTALHQIKQIIMRLRDESIPVEDIIADVSGIPGLTGEATRLLSFLSTAKRGLTR
jgi:UDP-N-acetylglucosamine acyltransferase